MMLELLARAKDGEGVKSGPIGLALILVLCIACYFLFKSMSKHLKKVREEFPTDDPSATAESPAAPGQDQVRPAEASDRADFASGTSSTSTAASPTDP